MPKKHVKPIVDILLATYNGEKYICEQVESILNQNFTDFRLIISDDCSVDRTHSILCKYAKSDERIILLHNDKNIGVKKNFEKLIRLSNSKYFMLSDQDDVWHYDKVKKSVEYLEESNSLLAYSDLRVVDEHLNEIHRSYWKYQKLRPLSGRAWKRLLVQNTVTGCTVIAKHQLKKYILPFPCHIYMHDWWMALVASLYGEIDYINESLIDYRQHDQNEIGATGLLSSYMNKPELNRSKYSSFIDYRTENIQTQLTLLHQYKRYVEVNQLNKEAKLEFQQAINYLITSYERHMKIHYFDVTFNSIFLKLKFPSNNLIRNLWSVLYFSIPIGAFYLTKLITWFIHILIPQTGK